MLTAARSTEVSSRRPSRSPPISRCCLRRAMAPAERRLQAPTSAMRRSIRLRRQIRWICWGRRSLGISSSTTLSDKPNLMTNPRYCLMTNPRYCRSAANRSRSLSTIRICRRDPLRMRLLPDVGTLQLHGWIGSAHVVCLWRPQRPEPQPELGSVRERDCLDRVRRARSRRPPYACCAIVDR